MAAAKRKPKTPPAATGAAAPAQAAPGAATGEDLQGGKPVPPSPPTLGGEALDAFSRDRIPAPPRGALSAPGLPRPTLPVELSDELSPQDHFIVWQLVAGARWQDALNLAGLKPSDPMRRAAIPDRIRLAAEYLVSELAAQCGVSRQWLLGQWVALYRRAARAEPVLDRQGNETGDYKFDGATAAKALTALGEYSAAGGQPPGRGPGGKRYSTDDVADLLHAIAVRGKPTLEQRIERQLLPDRGGAPLPDKA